MVSEKTKEMRGNLMEIKIVQYNHNLAGEVADMWNNSRDGWGGGNDISTAESVRQQEENSIDLNTYLAMEGKVVAGYCGLSEYREDSGALYIPLLNVREEYQGKKIGKQLVLNAVQRTIELGWPRLDLYTWAGNTKAVPLYKKCGFFWEERDDTVHLMNFIPSVLTTEAVKEFFEKADWYQDRKMEIEVKPDGRKENGFDFYEYKWEKDGRQLRMEYERKGRGLRLIETEQYLVAASISKGQELIFGAEYPIEFHIENKTQEPLEIEIEGFDDQNIHFALNKRVKVTGSSVVEGRFFVGEIAEEQNGWRTHPTVSAKVKINGKEAVFKLGIHAKYPARVTAKIPTDMPVLEADSEFYLELENHFAEDVHFSFTLPQARFIHFKQERVEMKLAGKERKLLPIHYTLSDYGFYQQRLEIEAKTVTGEAISFKKDIGLAFYGIGAKLFGESEDYWYAYNGLSRAYLSKFDNKLYFGRAGSGEEDPFFFYPKLGKPFSSEFSKKRPEKVEVYEEKGAVVLKAVYQSESFKDLQLYSIAKIYAEGLMVHNYEIHNLASEVTNQEIWLNDSNAFVHTLYEGVLPYDGQVIEVNDMKDGMTDYWEAAKLDENWIFNRRPSMPGGFCWSGEAKIHFQHWFLFFEHNLGVIPANSCVKTKPTFTSIGGFPTWEAFRAFALKNNTKKSLPPCEPVQFFPEGHNPFVKEQTTVHFKDVKLAHLDGELSLRLGQQVHKQVFAEEEAKNQTEFQITLHEQVQLIELDAKLKMSHSKHRSLLLQVKDAPVKTDICQDSGLQVYEVDNGVIKLKAAPEFFPTLYSMTHNGQEWLDTSFPQLKPKAWWNPWAGGIKNALQKVTANSILKEKCSAEFVTLKDNKGNPWQGIKLKVEIVKHEILSGLSFHQYFLMLPGAPIMCHTTEINQQTNRYFKNETWFSQASLKPDLAGESGWIEYGAAKKAYLAKGETELDVKQSFIVGHPSRSTRLQIIADYSAVQSDLYLNKEVLNHNVFSKLQLKHGDTFWTPPIFYLFHDQAVPEDALQDFKTIRFK